MTNQYKIADHHIAELHRRYYNAFSAFYIYEALRKLKSPPHAGKNKVLKNLKVLNIFKHFFILTEEAVRYYFFIELAKFFDFDKRTLSIPNVLFYIKKNLVRFNTKNFMAYRKLMNNPILEGMEKNYHPPTTKDLERIRKLILSIKPIVSKLRVYRNQSLAHDDLDKQKISITGVEIYKVFIVIQKILNLLSQRISWSTSPYDRVKEDVERDTKTVIKRLVEYQHDYEKKIEAQFRFDQKKYPN